MLRRDFLRRGAIAVAGGLLVGDAALEAFERLTHRKVYALGGFNEWPTGLIDITTSRSLYSLSDQHFRQWNVYSVRGFAYEQGIAPQAR